MAQWNRGARMFFAAHKNLYRLTGGALGGSFNGPILLLTTVGRKSGEERTTPLIHRTDDGRYVIVASKGGTPDDPYWFKNIEANPDDLEIQVRGDRFPVRASVAEGEDRERLWRIACRLYPGYETYQVRAGARKIPVVKLSRRGD